MFVHSLSAALLNVSLARIAIEGGCVHTQLATEDSTTEPPKTEVPS
jgi:hypothetical protein